MADEDEAFALDDVAIVESGRCIKKSVTLQTEEWTLVNLHHCILQSNIGQSDRIRRWSSSAYNAFGRNFACYDKSNQNQTQVITYFSYTLQLSLKYCTTFREIHISC